MPRTIKPKKPKSKYSPILLVRIYRLLKAGATDADVALDIGVTRKAFWEWKRDNPDVAKVVQMVQEELEAGKDLPSFVYSRLDPALKELWDQISGKNSAGRYRLKPVEEIELILLDQGKSIRQRLFLHALCVFSFSPSRALAAVNVSKKELDDWIYEDEDFSNLVKEMEWHKGNFFEETLVQLVKERNPAAVLFANRSYNAGRGYGARSSVDVNVNGGVMVGVLDLSELIPFLSEQCKTELLGVIQKRDSLKNPNLTVQEIVGRQVANLPEEVSS